jgi:hypothetical protein
MPERFSRLVIMNTWLHHDGYEYSPAIRHWITQNLPGGIFRDNIPMRFNWGTLMVVGTRRADPHQALFPALQGDAPQLPADAEAVRRADDAPFAGLGEDGVIGARQFPLCIPIQDQLRGDAVAQSGHFRSINAGSLPVHFIWGLADDIFTGDWGRTWHTLVPRSILGRLRRCFPLPPRHPRNSDRRANAPTFRLTRRAPSPKTEVTDQPNTTPIAGSKTVMTVSKEQPGVHDVQEE